MKTKIIVLLLAMTSSLQANYYAFQMDLMSAIERDDLPVARKAIEILPRELLDARVCTDMPVFVFGIMNERTPLQYAVFLDRQQIVKELLTAGASPNAGTDKFSFLGWTLAAEYSALANARSPEVLGMLLAHGGDPNATGCTGRILYFERPAGKAHEHFLIAFKRTKDAKFLLMTDMLANCPSTTDVTRATIRQDMRKARIEVAVPR